MAGIREQAEKARPVLLAAAERAEREARARAEAGAVWPFGSNERAAEIVIGQRREADAQGLRAGLDCTAFVLRVTGPEMRERIAAALRAEGVGNDLHMTDTIMALLTQEPAPGASP